MANKTRPKPFPEEKSTVNAKYIGEMIRATRTHSGLKLDEVSSLTGISIMTISEIERGKGNPLLSTTLTLLHALGLSFKLNHEKQQA